MHSIEMVMFFNYNAYKLKPIVKRKLPYFNFL